MHRYYEHHIELYYCTSAHPFTITKKTVTNLILKGRRSFKHSRNKRIYLLTNVYSGQTRYLLSTGKMRTTYNYRRSRCIYVVRFMRSTAYYEIGAIKIDITLE